MSKMKELYEKVAASAALQAEFAGIMERATAENVAETQEALLAFAKKQGYEATLEEITEFFEGMTTEEKELSDTELDAVAGGKSPGSAMIPISTSSGGKGCLQLVSVTRGVMGKCNDLFN